MSEDIKTILAKRYEELPEALKKAITSSDLPHLIHDVTLKNSLHVDQAGTLETEITLVLMGLENYDTFAGNLEREMNIAPLLAKQLAAEVDETIFKEVRKYLISFTDLKNKKPEDESLRENIFPVASVNEQATVPPTTAVEKMTEPSSPKIEKVPIVQNTKPAAYEVVKSSPSIIEPNFTEDKLKNINISIPEKISLAPKSKITNPYLEPLD